MRGNSVGSVRKFAVNLEEQPIATGWLCVCARACVSEVEYSNSDLLVVDTTSLTFAYEIERFCDAQGICRFISTNRCSPSPPTYDNFM